MESDSIVDLVPNTPRALGCYIQSIVMDNGTNFHNILQEDLGNQSAGGLEKCLARITFFADPGHHKRKIQNHYF